MKTQRAIARDANEKIWQGLVAKANEYDEGSDRSNPPAECPSSSSYYSPSDSSERDDENLETRVRSLVNANISGWQTFNLVQNRWSWCGKTFVGF